MSLANALREGNVKVAVLCGGPGAEREVSLASGDMVYTALTEAGVSCDKAEIPAEGHGDYLENLDCGLAVMMLHGEWGEDGGAQSILERRGVAFTGSCARVSALAMDKDACKRIFLERGIPTAPWIIGSGAEEIAAKVAEANLRFPVFVKPNFRGSSVGASRVERPDGLAAAVELALAEGSVAMVEEMVVGRELTVGWLDGTVLPTIEMVADGAFYDYRAKYQSDNTQYICPADLVPATSALVEKCGASVAGTIGVRDIARVDLMLGVDGPMVLEVNTLPGFTSHSLLPMAAARAGVDRRSLCLSLVGMAAKRMGIVWHD